MWAAAVWPNCRIRIEGCEKLLHLLRFKRYRVQEQLTVTGKGEDGERGVRDTRFGSKPRIEPFGLFTSGVGCCVG